MKFLVDECLSPDLVKLAHDRGHGESSHVVNRKPRTASFPDAVDRFLGQF
jgi:hypothetical protein